MPVAIWTFYDYVSPSGTNQITSWYSAISVAEQGVFDTFLNTVAKMQKLEEPYVKAISGKQYAGLFELIFSACQKQHRVLGVYGPQGVRYSFTMLIGCTHKQRIYDPPNAFDTAMKRVQSIKSKRAKVNEHD